MIKFIAPSAIFGFFALSFYDYKLMISENIKNEHIQNKFCNDKKTISFNSQFITYDVNHPNKTEISGIINCRNSIILNVKDPIGSLYKSLHGFNTFFPNFYKRTLINIFMANTNSKYNLITTVRFTDDVKTNIKAVKGLNWRKHGWNCIVIGESRHIQDWEYMKLRLYNPVIISTDKMFDNTHHPEPEKIYE